jgi:diadenosine tetraphosphate (Ap4A) HIT family hydrolase
MFELDSRLAQDTYLLGEFDLSLVLLNKDANFPWCILVPKREEVYDLHQLSEEDQQQFIRESSRLSCAMMTLFGAYKMNVAALGNVVRQLHIHHIARFPEDAVWPQPIWGKLPALNYTKEQLGERILGLRQALSGKGFYLSRL